MPELVWDGKYDARGRRVAPLRVALPFQTVETVNESAQERQRSLFVAEPEVTGWRNRLIWGDKKYVLPALLEEFAGKVGLIYIDPPFASGQDFALPIAVDGQGFAKEPSMLEVKAYRDTWGSGLNSYLGWFYSMAQALHSLLASNGSLYVHLDPGVSHYIKTLLDEVFGPDNFRSEVIWKRTGAHGSARRWAPVHDVLLLYTRSEDYVWNPVFQPYSDDYLEKFNQQDERGRFMPISLTGPGTRKGDSGKPWRGVDPTSVGRHWQPSSTAYDVYEALTGETLGSLPMQERLDHMEAAGLIWWPKKEDGTPRFKQYVQDVPGVAVQDIVSDIAVIASHASERLGYPTQKPEALLERIIRCSSNEGDLVLDCVCGSGTTAVAAEKLDRPWIASDLGRFAIHTARKRLLSIGGVRPFVVQNLGKYERQLWQAAEFGESATARTAAYRRFILDLYHAQPVLGYTWLHGLKGGRMVHVGTVDAPVTNGDVKQIVAEFRRAIGTGRDASTTKGVDLLGWDFAFELNEVARQDAEKAGIDLRLVRIPREVLEKRAVEQGDIRFFELAALSVGLKQSGRKVTLTLEDFVIPLEDVPADVQKAVTHWSLWIDYWAVDWDNKDDTFHNEWQAYRTRKSKDLTLTTAYEYAEPGDYTVVVKVIDILGNDTTKTLTAKVVGRGA